jgi:5-methylcytosine-specific restriction endonuclease McrA
MKYRKKCVDWAKNEAKKRDNYICQHCGKKITDMHDAHGSHIYPEGTYTSMSADVDNIICLCFHCHIYWWHKHPIEAGDWFKKRFPELHKTLKKRSQVIQTINWKKRYETLN